MAAGAGGAPMGALEGALLRYDEALAHKSAALPKLDGWYRAELRKAIAKRAHENGAATLEATERNQQGSTAAAGYLTRLELAKLIKWKMTRGKFRPRLEQLAMSNAEDDVRRTTRAAFARLLAPTEAKGSGKIREEKVDVSATPDMAAAKAALDSLSTLRGVGPATASAMLALVAPHSLPFMSDEALLHAAGLVSKPKYNVAEWRWFVDHVRARLLQQQQQQQQPSGDESPTRDASDHGQTRSIRSADDLERAAWAYATLGLSLQPHLETDSKNHAAATPREGKEKGAKRIPDDAGDKGDDVPAASKLAQSRPKRQRRAR